jgi:hypothetical protein
MFIKSKKEGGDLFAPSKIFPSIVPRQRKMYAQQRNKFYVSLFYLRGEEGSFEDRSSLKEKEGGEKCPNKQGDQPRRRGIQTFIGSCRIAFRVPRSIRVWARTDLVYLHHGKVTDVAFLGVPQYVEDWGITDPLGARVKRNSLISVVLATWEEGSANVILEGELATSFSDQKRSPQIGGISFSLNLCDTRSLRDKNIIRKVVAKKEAAGFERNTFSVESIEGNWCVRENNRGSWSWRWRWSRKGERGIGTNRQSDEEEENWQRHGEYIEKIRFDSRREEKRREKIRFDSRRERGKKIPRRELRN